MPTSALHQPVLDWYASAARLLPWRATGATAWGVLVSEVMLQQTPVARVLPVWDSWLRRWPSPAHLAAAPPGEAVREWGRLGYPRRALRLHAAATAIADRHGGQVPSDHQALLDLPGVGSYTAAAVAAFAFGQRHAVLDTNVRRVHARLLGGVPHAAPAVTAAERRTAAALLPDDPAVASTWSVAVMELGALVCTARAPRCTGCPVARECAWRRAGSPAGVGPRPRSQPWQGTDRQVRGRLLAVLRSSSGPVEAAAVASAWPQDEVQRQRCMGSLLADGLIEALPDGTFALPGAAVS